MVVDACPRCSKSLPDLDVPPAYCPYCGAKLLGSSTPYEPPHMHTTVDAAPRYFPEQAAEAEKVPESIGGYRLTTLLGTGGMGRVYEAVSETTGQVVAVKLLSSRLSSSPTSVERFRQEGLLASQISHPLCVFVYTADAEGGRPYIVMERMPGQTLKDAIDLRGPLDPIEAIQLILDVIDGLMEAHRLGFIHRDVKPSNCFLTKDGRVKIGDFGLSRSLSKDNALTQTGTFLGTVLYASPEQIRGEPVDVQADVYSVCATLFHLLAGRAPFQQDNMTAALAQIVSETAPGVRDFAPETPKTLEKIIARGLERDGDRRWPTLGELRAALVALLPATRKYAGPGVRCGAYVIDEILLRLALIYPLTYLLKNLLSGISLSALELGLFVAYFAYSEWYFGSSAGKRLLGLQVVRSDSNEPPAFRAILVRTVAFCALIGFRFFDGDWMADPGPVGKLARFLFLVSAIIGLLLLGLPMRGSKNYRGFHEKLSKTGVIRIPRRREEIEILPAGVDRLASLPALPDDCDFDLAPYIARRGLPGPNPGEWVILGEDPLLGRMLLFHLQPTSGDVAPQRLAVQRSTRLRLHGTGTATCKGVEYRWCAYVSPNGAPLADLTDPTRTLRWPETRLILEQLVEELREARKDGTLPAELSLDQVWVRQDGRLQLLDFPVGLHGKAGGSAGDELHLVRQTLTQALEGTRAPDDPRAAIAAPIPRHARRMLQDALADSREESLADLQKHLRETRNQPARVDAPQRFFQISVMAAFLSVGLATMFSVAGLFTVILVLWRETVIVQAESVLAALEDGRKDSGWQADPSVRKLLADPNFRPELRRLLDEFRGESARYRKGLTYIERELAEAMEPERTLRAGNDDANLVKWTATLGVILGNIESENRSAVNRRRAILNEDYWRQIAAVILFWPILWALLALLFRGGPSLYFGQIRLVDRRGRPARRFLCLARSLLVWLPVALLLVGSVWFQAYLPAWVSSHAVLWWLAFGLVVGYVIHALKHPEQSWLDRQLGLVLIPE